ncbi:doublesex- and mab-3-related transcription factor A2-like [Wyeomyia smithii]|nr:doublesex- and mab-3-related transcription factor A2-like [Wyeomyia smithii]
MGTQLEMLPPGKIYGMTVTDPCPSPQIELTSTMEISPTSSGNKIAMSSDVIEAKTNNVTVSQSALDMLSQLFPHRKRSVLELILKRCDLDLLKAIEQCSKNNPSSAFKPPLSSASHITHHQLPFNSPSPPNYPSLIAYPKWLLPMSIPVPMGHLAPRCTLPNCVMCVHHPV